MTKRRREGSSVLHSGGGDAEVNAARAALTAVPKMTDDARRTPWRWPWNGSAAPAVPSAGDRRRTGHRRPGGGGFSLPLLLAVLLMLKPPSAEAAPFDTCYDALLAADGDGDGTLAVDEYAAAVTELSYGTVTSVAYGSALTDAFSASVNGVKWSSQTSGSNTTAAACRATYSAILDAEGVSFSTQICYVGLIVGDADRSGALAQTYEYSRFVNYLSGGTVGSSTAFQDLSAPLQGVFTGFADASTSEIDVSGSKPGDTPTAAQERFLADLCDQAAVAIHATDTTTDDQAPVAAPVASTPKPTPRPTAASGTAAPSAATDDAAPTAAATTDDNYTPGVSLSTCTYGMAFSDLDRNGLLDQDEYVRFLNRLTSNAYGNATFATLPAGLQDNYAILAAGGDGIDIAGSTPGSTPTAAQAAHLQEVCQATDLAIQAESGGGGNTTEAPTQAASGGTPAPTAAATTSGVELPFETCVRYLALSDLDRDGTLSDTEYLRFLTYGSGRQIAASSFDSLDPTLQDNFNALADSSGTIDINGSQFGDTPTSQETAHLTEVCDATVEAMNEVLNPNQPPSNAANETVYNAWIVNDPTGAITSASLRSGLNREALDGGYASFAVDQFAEFLKKYSGSRRLQGSTGIFFVDGSAVNYELVDFAPCPPSNSGKPVTGTCIKVYSSFVVATVAMSEQASTLIGNMLMQQTMGSIPTALQPYITNVYPDTSLVVLGGNLPLQPPSQGDDGVSDDDDNSAAQSKNSGAIAASVIIVLLLVGAAGFGYYFMKKKHMTCEDLMLWLPDIRGLSKRHRKEEDAEKTADIEKAAFGDEDDDYGFNAESTKMNGDFQYSDNEDESEFSVLDKDASTSDNGDEPAGIGRGGKFTFGRGKKKAAGNFDGAIGDMGVDAFNETAANDFADYGFDDPVADIALGGTDDVFDTKGDRGFESAWGNAFSGKSGTLRAEKSSVGGSNSKQSDAEDGDGSRSGSYSGSDDETYDEEEEGNGFNREAKHRSNKAPDNVRHLDAMVDQGDWDGVMAVANKNDNFSIDGSEASKPSLQESIGSSHSAHSDESSTSPTPALIDPEKKKDETSGSSSFFSHSSEELKRRAQYRAQVEALVKKVVPDELDNIDAMLEQFAGREAELIHTLKTMEQRTTTQRARKAVHKSKAMPLRENIPFGPGGSEGSAAIAAASTIGVQVGAFDDPGGFNAGPSDFGFGVQAGAFDGGYDANSYSKGSYSQSERSGSRSYYSDEQSDNGSRSYYSDEQSGSRSRASGSQYSGSQTGSYQSGSHRSGDEDSYVSGEGSKTGSRASQSQRSGSYYSDEQGSYVSGDGSRSYRSGEGSYQSGEGSRTGSHRSGEGSQTGSYRSGNGSQTGSYRSGEGSPSGSSYRSGDGSRSGSYRSGEGSRTGSYRSGDGSRTGSSYRSGEASQASYRSGEEEGSYVSGDASQSYRSGEDDEPEEEGSFVSGEASQSYRSGEDEEEGSYVSGEEEGSYVSGEEGSQSYRSGEDEEEGGSYVSGEEEDEDDGQGSFASGGDESRSYQSGSQQSGSYQSEEGSRSQSSHYSDLR